MVEQFLTPAALPRRAFMRAASATVAAVALVGCADDTATPADPNLITLQSDEAGLLNVAYLLAQVRFALHQLLVNTPPADLQAGELAYLNDLRDHELIHREALKYVLGTSAALPTLTFSFTSLPLNTRTGALEAARRLADLAAAAYPGLLPFFTNAVRRELVFKMASVQARHAAVLRSLLNMSFAGSDVADANGQEILKTPAQVVEAIAPYLVTFSISAANVATL